MIPRSPSIHRGVCTALLLTAALVATCLQVLALDPSKPLKQYGTQSWESDTGLPQNTVHAIVQTTDGFIWMATEGGLVRFDGQDLRTFDSGSTHTLPADSVSSLTAGPHGVLWIGTSAGLVRREGSHFSLMTTDDGLPSNMVRFTCLRRDGSLLVATASGVAIGDDHALHPLNGVTADLAPELFTEDSAGTIWMASGHQIFSLPPGRVTASTQRMDEAGDIQVIASGATGDLWVGGRSGLILLHDGRKVPLNLSTGAGMSVTSLQPMPNGDMWIGTDAGLDRYAHGTLTRVDGTEGIPSGRVLRLFADREGALWVAFDRSVSRILPNDPAHLQDAIGISGTLSIFEDREGDAWFGTDVGGATILRDQAFSTLTTKDGLSDDFVRAVFQDHSGAIWLGTNRGGLDHIVQGKISTLQAGRGGLSSNVVLALAESRSGADHDLWIGTPDGLSRLRNGRLKLFTTADGLPDDFVRSLYTDTDGSLWIGTRNGLSHYAGGTFNSYSRMDGLGSDLIGSILRGSDGTLWVGTLNGLSRLDGTSFHNLNGNPITTMAEDHEGTLWVASHAAGLTRIRPGSAPVIVDWARLGLPAEIYSILESNNQEAGGKQADDSLWLGSSKGIFRVPLDKLNAYIDKRSSVLPVESFGVADGMKISECSSGGRPAAWRMSDGSLWFATLRGTASIKPGAGYQNRTAPFAAIEDVLVDDQVTRSDQPLIIQPGHDRLTIHYAGLSFRAPQKVRFRYKLEGFDHDWIEAGSRRTAFYTNLPAASYHFVVLASVGNGIWSEVPGEFSFTIKPHFYRTLWFYGLIFLLLALLTWFVYQSRVRIVEAQYQAVLAERTRIAREIHDTLAQGYVGISVQLEVASRLLQGSKEAAAQQLESTKEYVRSSLEDARSSIWNLRSPGAESETLPARLAAAIKSRRQSNGGAPTLRLEVHGSFRPVDRRVEDELLKITQEAMSNAIRHACATAVAVVLSYDTDWLELTISDDGNGFDPSADRAGHYGVQGMHERSASIGAKATIRSDLGTGTTVIISLGLRS